MSAFEQIMNQFNNALPQWQAIGLDLAKQLFVILVVIQIAWSAVLWMLNRNNPSDLLVDFVKKMLVILFFWAVLINYDVWIPAIVESLKQVAERMTGMGAVSPSDVMSRGVDLSTRIMTSAKHQGFIQHIFGSILASVVGAVVFFIFVRIGIEMFLIIVGGQIILAGGVILLGFAGTKWSRQFTERYLSAVISIGIKMLFITLIAGIGETLAPGWSDILKNVPSDQLMEAYMAVLAAALVYYYLALRIPEMASNLLTGSFNLNFGSGVGTAITGAAVAGMYGAGMVATGIGGVIRGTTGAGSALGAAASLAKAQGQTSTLITKGGKPYMSRAGETVINTLGNISSGTGQYIKQSVGSAISKTTGGKIANQLKTMSASEGKGGASNAR